MLHQLHLQALIHHYGYAGVFVILFLENVGIPFPAETTLTISGFEWMHGVFHLLPLLLVAGLGNIWGSTVAYGIGRWLGRPVIVRFGQYVGITHERLDKAESLFEKYQSPVVLVGKFIAGIRVLVPYIAGINKMSFWLFSIYNAISAWVWAAVFILLGNYIGKEWSRYHQYLARYWIPLLIVVVPLFGVYLYLRRKRRK